MTWADGRFDGDEVCVPKYLFDRFSAFRGRFDNDERTCHLAFG